MAERLTRRTKTGWVLKLDDPKNDFEAKQQLMVKFKLACEKLGKLEDMLENHAIEDVYKTKAEAEHHFHHANITRTEALPFLTWEDFQKTGYLDFIGADKNHYCIDKSSEGIVLGKYVNNSKALYEWVKHWKGFNEANFYKAYDEAVKLFKGEE